jgi:hypothetical protein
MAKDPVEKTAAQLAGESTERPAKGPARVDLIQALEELRGRVHNQLDALETLARDRARQGSRTLESHEEQLQQRATELEEVNAHMQTEADRWQRERQSMLEQIENDRRLLADAWDRLEREQVKAFAVAPTTAPPSTFATPAPWPATISSATSRDQPVAEEVLRQFQSLRRDVRRTAVTNRVV